MNFLYVIQGWAFILNGVFCQRFPKVTFNEHKDYEGEKKIVKLRENTCENVLDFNDRTSSIETDVCITVYEHSDCRGKKINIYPKGIYNLQSVNFNDVISSVTECNHCSQPTETPVIHMDTSKAPDLGPQGQIVKKLLERWFPMVQSLMTTSAYVPVKEIFVRYDPEYGGAAGVVGNNIIAGANHFRNNPTDYGAFIHELTHVVHQAINCPGWLVEAYAEWVRRWIYEPWTAKTKPTHENHYTQGYTEAAWLLVYVNSAKYGTPVLYYLNKACQAGTWYDGIWVDLTGKTVDELWNEMLDDDEYPWKK